MENESTYDHKGIHRAQRFAKNAFFLVTSRVLGISITLGIIALVARYSGSELFGFYALATAISITLRPLVEFGLDTIVCREISKSYVDVGSRVSTVLIMRISICLIIVAITS